MVPALIGASVDGALVDGAAVVRGTMRRVHRTSGRGSASGRAGGSARPWWGRPRRRRGRGRRGQRCGGSRPGRRAGAAQMWTPAPRRGAGRASSRATTGPGEDVLDPTRVGRVDRGIAKGIGGFGHAGCLRRDQGCGESGLSGSGPARSGVLEASYRPRIRRAACADGARPNSAGTSTMRGQRTESDQQTFEPRRRRDREDDARPSVGEGLGVVMGIVLDDPLGVGCEVEGGPLTGRRGVDHGNGGVARPSNCSSSSVMLWMRSTRNTRSPPARRGTSRRRTTGLRRRRTDAVRRHVRCVRRGRSCSSRAARSGAR